MWNRKIQVPILAVGMSTSDAFADATTPADTGDGLYRVDVTGLPDDAQAGERLRVALGNSDGMYRVASVDQTLLCARGVTGGLCL